MNLFKSIKNLTKVETGIWITSLLVILVSFGVVEDKDFLIIGASLIGATALIFVGKGDAIGQLFTIFFALLYSLVSLRFRYHGEMITYLGMTAPSALLAMIKWLKNPYSEREVKVNRLSKKEWGWLCVVTILVTCLMGGVLRYFDTSNLLFSTISVTTSFLASALTILRSPYYALAYAANDIVLIILWVLATMENSVYLPMIICFVIFLINDVYGFINWQRMKKRQKKVPDFQ